MATILVIDDDAQIRALLDRFLSKEGHQVLLAENGDQGLSTCAATEIELVVTDILMPEKEGLESIMEIRKHWPDMPIMAISGGGRLPASTYLDLARKLGASPTLQKPFTREEFLASVNGVLAKR